VSGAADCGVFVKPLSDALKIVTQEDVDLAKKPSVRAEQNLGSDADSTNLMGLLGDIDGLKNEIHERMRRIEAVKQAKSVLLEDAERTEALNKRLAEIGKAMSVVQSGIHAPEVEKEATEAVRRPARENVAGTEARHAPVRVLNEGVALPWPTTEEPLGSAEEVQIEGVAEVGEPIVLSPGEAPVTAEVSLALESAFQRLEEVEQSRMQAWTQADEAVQEAKRLLDEATSQLNHAVSREEQAAQEFHSAQETLTSAFHSAQEALTTAFESAQARLEAADQPREAARIEAWKQADESTQEARRLFDHATSNLNHAVGREEQVTQELQSAQEALTTAHQAASDRLEEAERSWKKTDQATAEAKRLLEQSTAELVQARKKEESIAASLQSVREEFTTAYQSASQRLQEAEEFWKRGDQAAKEAQQLIDQSTAELLQARKAEETAAADLLSARQELTTAYQFAAVAAQRRLDAVDAFQKATRWMIFGVALSWIAMVWMGWFIFHGKMPIWGPGVLSIVLVGLAFAVTKRGAREA
jgi:hypothetical protein